MIHLAEPSVADMVDQLQRAIASRIATKQPILKTHERIVTMYRGKESHRNDPLYDTVLKQGHYSLWGRLAMHQSPGAFRLVVVFDGDSSCGCCRVVAASNRYRCCSRPSWHPL
jgi:hypothetical protein